MKLIRSLFWIAPWFLATTATATTTTRSRFATASISAKVAHLADDMEPTSTKRMYLRSSNIVEGFMPWERRVQYNDDNICTFNKQTCFEGEFFTSCKALANKVEDEWCHSLHDNTQACCGLYDDCCEHDKLLYTIVIGGTLLIFLTCVLLVCIFVAPCPLQKFLEERRNEKGVEDSS